MNEGFFNDCEGPIRGLRLPLNAWDALQTGDITTLDQLRAMADRIQWLPSIGPKLALTIRVELSSDSVASQRMAMSFAIEFHGGVVNGGIEAFRPCEGLMSEMMLL